MCHGKISLKFVKRFFDFSAGGNFSSKATGAIEGDRQTAIVPSDLNFSLHIIHKMLVKKKCSLQVLMLTLFYWNNTDGRCNQLRYETLQQISFCGRPLFHCVLDQSKNAYSHGINHKHIASHVLVSCLRVSHSIVVECQFCIITWTWDIFLK